MNTTTTLFLHSDPAMYTSPGRTYARVGVRDPALMYVRGRILFLAPWPLYVRVNATRAPLLRHVRASTSTSMYVHVRDQNDNTTYASTRWVPTVRHFLVCGDVAGGSQQSGGRIIFFSDALPCVRRCSWWVPAVRGKHFFHEIRWPVRWVPAGRWRIIILHVIRRHFPWVRADNGGDVFFMKYSGPFGGPRCQVED